MVVTNIIIIYETATKCSRLHFMHKLPFFFFTISEDFHQKERANTEFWRKKCYLMSAIRWGFVLSSSLANPPRDRRHQIAIFLPNSAFSNIVWALSRQKKIRWNGGTVHEAITNWGKKSKRNMEHLGRWAPFIIIIIMIIIIAIVSSSLLSWSSSSFIIHSLIQFNSNWLLSRPTKEWTETKTRRVESLPKGWT